MLKPLPLALLGLMLLTASRAAALEACLPVVGELVSADGTVEVLRAGEATWQAAALGAEVCERDTVRTGGNSRAALSLINDTVLRIDQNATLHLVQIFREPEETSFLELVFGAFQLFARAPRQLAVDTPYLNATIEGTEFLVQVLEDRSRITVLEGVVAAFNEIGEMRLASGDSAEAEAGQAPVPFILVRPRDAVQWALHYPPVLAVLGGGDGIPPDVPAPLAEALGLAGARDLTGAFEALERVRDDERDASFHLYHAALLLTVGRVEEARAAIEQTLALRPQEPLAFALRAVILVVRSEREPALADARRAVELAPELTAPWIALSYAQQAAFELEAARDSLLRAIEAEPADALAWARLSELWLALSDRRRAREAAEEAVRLAPEVQRVQVVLGFADLVEFRTAGARAAFERAIALDSSDPMPRLGLGLAQIRDSALEDGRRNLEIAVGLDSGNALLRSYLGKAYFEERRPPLDADQYAIAKELDPLDPTPWLYDAIRKQTENRPGEALADLQRSIFLNDNRAVYRSRLALDQDRAARGASLGRIYDDLGFLQLGHREATRSLALDPGNDAAHRFLSDIYGGFRRTESARVSELFQAQMLQDININPVQPSRSETNLNIVTGGGPAQAGLNEFTPLFERDRIQLNATGEIGNDDTFGGEAVASALVGRFSLSAGAFHHQTDGWRENHDIEHNIYNLFAQAALTPELNAQVELRRRRSEAGDLALNFDPDDFSPTRDFRIDQDIARVGLRYSPTPSSDLLLSLFYGDQKETQSDLFDTPFGLFEVDAVTEDEGYQAEVQYIYRHELFNIIAGGAFSAFDRDIEVLETVEGEARLAFAREEDIKHRRGYLYGNLRLPRSVLWTAGISYDDYDQEELRIKKFNPKFGAQFSLTEDFGVRGAVAQIVKPLLTNNRTLEPTQVAGFNQLFDDANGDRSLRYGVGFDWRLADNLFVGAEATWRDLDLAVISVTEGRALFFDAEEQTHRAYINWLPVPQVALSAEFAYDRWDATRSDFTLREPVPERLQTFSVPLSARYFHPSGFFAGFGATYVNQDVRRTPGNFFGFAEGRDDFVVLDASVGYRFPNRRGVASLQVNNLLDKRFRYQDDSFREFGDRPAIGPYLPRRQIVGRLTLSW